MPRIIPSLSVRLLCSILAIGSIAVQSCKKKPEGKLSQAQIVEVSFAGETGPVNPSVLLNKRVNLDSDPGLETVSVISHRDMERLIILKKIDDTYKRIVSMDFAPAGGPNPTQSKVKVDAGTVGRNIRRVMLRPLGKGVSRNSVILEYAESTGSPGKWKRQLMIFTDMKRVFDSRVSMAAHPLIRAGRELEYRVEPNGRLVIFSENRGYEAEIRYNGREAVIWYTGNPLVSYQSIKVVKDEKNPGYLRATLQLKNIGSNAHVSYISLSFPRGTRILREKRRKGLRFYHAGSSISDRSGRNIRSRFPLLELTHQGWRSWHRLGISFSFRPTKNAKDFFLIRSAFRQGKETMYSPPERGTSAAAVDQQGYRSYPFSLVQDIVPKK